MGRSSGRSSGRSAPPPARRAPPPAAPKAQAPPPAMAAPAPQQGGMLSGLGATMVQGFAFGTGSSIARNVVDSMMGGGSSQQAAPQAPVQQYQAPQQNNVCEFDRSALLKCMNETPTNCDYYYQALQACQQNNM